LTQLLKSILMIESSSQGGALIPPKLITQERSCSSVGENAPFTSARSHATRESSQDHKKQAILLENQSIMRNIMAGCRSAGVPPSKPGRRFLFKSTWCCQYDGQDTMVHSSGQQFESFAIFVYAICKQSELQNDHFSAILYRSINGFSSQMPSTFCRMIGLLYSPHCGSEIDGYVGL
jgi:hypothetical protein